MAGEMLPLFPLSVVLLPHTNLPLHIFEDRYKEMIGEAIGGHTEFGVVLATGNGIVNTGCTAIVQEVLQKHSDGRMDIMTIGVRRYEIISLNEDKSYLRGVVEFFDDLEGAAPRELRQRALEAWRVAGDGAEPAPDEEAPQLSFLLAHPIEDLAFRQQLLASRSETDRLKRLVEFFPTWRARQQYAQQVREAAPHNGHARLPQS